MGEFLEVVAWVVDLLELVAALAVWMLEDVLFMGDASTFSVDALRRPTEKLMFFSGTHAI